MFRAAGTDRFNGPVQAPVPADRPGRDHPLRADAHHRSSRVGNDALGMDPDDPV